MCAAAVQEVKLHRPTGVSSYAWSSTEVNGRTSVYFNRNRMVLFQVLLSCLILCKGSRKCLKQQDIDAALSYVTSCLFPLSPLPPKPREILPPAVASFLWPCDQSLALYPYSVHMVPLFNEWMYFGFLPKLMQQYTFFFLREGYLYAGRCAVAVLVRCK